MKTHIRGKEISVQEVEPGIKRQIMAHDSHLMLVKVQFDTGAVASKHTHPHQQITYVLEGVFEVEIAGKKEALQQGDCFIVPADALHGATCIQAGVLIDTFSPAREDFLD